MFLISNIVLLCFCDDMKNVTSFCKNRHLLTFEQLLLKHNRIASMCAKSIDKAGEKIYNINMKISEMKYERIDVDRACETVKKLTERMRKAASGREMSEIRNECIEEAKKIQTMSSLCYIRFTLNTSDEFYLGEKTYYDENSPRFSSAAVEFNRAFLSNPHLSEALGLMNPNVAKVYELELGIMDEKIIPELVEESRLVTEYDRLMSETTFEFKGREMPLSVLRKYFDDRDRKIRRASMEALGKTLSGISGSLDGIFDKLVRVRAKMARKMGFKSFAEMGDCQMGRYSYGRKEIGKFRDAVASDVTPLVAKHKKSIAAKLGLDEIMLYDNEICFKEGNPEPILSPKQMFAAAREMYRDMGEETGAFIDSMLAADAFDVYARKGKWGGGYCTSIDDYKQPFILANFNGSSGDVDVLTHEAGHALAYYKMFENNVDYELNLGTMSVAEIHSMAMEFLAWKYMDKFFGKRAQDYKYMHLMSSLTFIPYGAMVDEFQEICYENPDMTPSERNKEWQKLDIYYRPYLSTKGIPYIENGTRWQYQMHIYENPMYYIDYCLSQSVAHQILVRSQKDYKSAFELYMTLLGKGGELPFGQLVQSVGLKDPLGEGALKTACEEIDALLLRLSND